MEKIEKVEEHLNHIEKENNLMLDFYKTMLKEKNSEKNKWFIICLVELAIIIAMFVGVLIYESQFETVIEGETTTVETGNGITTYLDLENSNTGDFSYGENY